MNDGIFDDFGIDLVISVYLWIRALQIEICR